MGPSREEWEAMKALINHLYLKQGIPIKKVRDILKKDHDFDATVHQYHTKIKNWGFRKNLSQKEWAELENQTRDQRRGGRGIVVEIAGVQKSSLATERSMRRYMAASTDRFSHNSNPTGGIQSRHRHKASVVQVRSLSPEPQLLVPAPAASSGQTSLWDDFRVTIIRALSSNSVARREWTRSSTGDITDALRDLSLSGNGSWSLETVDTSLSKARLQHTWLSTGLQSTTRLSPHQQAIDLALYKFANNLGSRSALDLLDRYLSADVATFLMRFLLESTQPCAKAAFRRLAFEAISHGHVFLVQAMLRAGFDPHEPCWKEGIRVFNGGVPVRTSAFVTSIELSILNAQDAVFDLISSHSSISGTARVALESDHSMLELFAHGYEFNISWEKSRIHGAERFLPKLLRLDHNISFERFHCIVELLLGLEDRHVSSIPRQLLREFRKRWPNSLCSEKVTVWLIRFGLYELSMFKPHDHGLDLDCIISKETTLLTEAILSRDHRLANLLLDHGASPDGSTQRIICRFHGVQEHSFYVPTPLQCASYLDDVEIAIILLRRGADINLQLPEEAWHPLPNTTRFGKTALQAALSYGKASIAEFLLLRGASVFGGELVMAIEGGLFQLVDALLARGLRLCDQRPMATIWLCRVLESCRCTVVGNLPHWRRHDTALQAAVAAELNNFVQKCISELPNEPVDTGAMCEALSLASRTGDFTVISSLLSKYGELKNLDEKSRDFLIHLAALQEDDRLLSLIMDGRMEQHYYGQSRNSHWRRSLEVSRPDRICWLGPCSENPLTTLIEHKKQDWAKRLLHAGYPITMESLLQLTTVDEWYYNLCIRHFSALPEAWQYLTACLIRLLGASKMPTFSPSILRRLLEAGANPNLNLCCLPLIQDGWERLHSMLTVEGTYLRYCTSTPLTMAIRAGFEARYKFVDILVQYGAKVNHPFHPLCPDFRLSTAPNLSPLVLAALRGDARMVRQLLGHGADPMQPNQPNQTAIERAAGSGRLEVLQILLQSGNISRSRFRKALVSAILGAEWCGHDETAQYLRDLEPWTEEDKEEYATQKTEQEEEKRRKDARERVREYRHGQLISITTSRASGDSHLPTEPLPPHLFNQNILHFSGFFYDLPMPFPFEDFGMGNQHDLSLLGCAPVQGTAWEIDEDAGVEADKLICWEGTPGWGS